MTKIVYPTSNQKKLWEAKKERPKYEWKGFPAKYDGTCYICKSQIFKGDMIRLFDTGKAYHIECV